jgi:uncharacterized membrane protein YcaP (DUF421 family)
MMSNLLQFPPKYTRQFAFLDVLFVLLLASTLVLPVFINQVSIINGALHSSVACSFQLALF